MIDILSKIIGLFAGQNTCRGTCCNNITNVSVPCAKQISEEYELIRSARDKLDIYGKTEE